MKQKVPVTISLVTEFYGAGDSAMKAIYNVTLQIFGNEFLTLLGPSGCGKTTLLSMIAWFEDITSGWIKLFDDELDGIRKTFFGHSFISDSAGRLRAKTSDQLGVASADFDFTAMRAERASWGPFRDRRTNLHDILSRLYG